MLTLFTGTYDRLVKFIFNFYDFDKDGFISKEDIRTVLSYVPLNTKHKYNNQKLKYEKEDYKDRIESQDELYSILDKSFEKKSKVGGNIRPCLKIVHFCFCYLIYLTYELLPNIMEELICSFFLYSTAQSVFRIHQRPDSLRCHSERPLCSE